MTVTMHTNMIRPSIGLCLDCPCSFSNLTSLEAHERTGHNVDRTSGRQRRKTMEPGERAWIVR